MVNSKSKLENECPEKGTRTHSNWLKVGVHLSVIFILSTLIFGNTLNNVLHLDSIYRVGNNPELDKVWPPWRHFTDPRTSTSIPQITAFRPLLPLTLSINNAFSDFIGCERLTGFHLGNIAIHIGTSFILYFFFIELLQYWAKLAKPKRDLCNIAFASTLIFAVHPISGVPVNYIAARDLLLMMFFLMGSLFTYVRMRRLGETFTGWAFSLGLLSLSMLSKQNSVVAPVLIFTFELLFARHSYRSWKTWLYPLAFGSVIAIFFVWTEIILDFSDLGQLHTEAMTPWIYACTMGRVHLLYYIRNFIWPFSMRPLPYIEAAEGIFDPGVIIGIIFILIILVIAFVFWRRAPLLSWCILSYWGLFAPTSSIRPFRYLVVDYRQYPSLAFLSLGLILGLTLLLSNIPRQRLICSIIVAVVICYFGISTFFMNRIWQTEEKFWGQSVRYGATALAHMNYAMSIQYKNPPLAEKHFHDTLKLSPGHTYTHINLGLFYIRSGKVEEGLSYVKKATQLAPSWAISHYWLSKAYRQVGKLAEAQVESHRAADLDPRNAKYQYQAAWDLQEQGDVLRSLPYLERVARISPGYKIANFLEGFALQKAGRWKEAEYKYRHFLQQKPDHAQTHFNLAYGLMNHGEHTDAIDFFMEALRLNPDMSSTHHWLSICYDELGNSEKAAYYRAQYEATKH